MRYIHFLVHLLLPLLVILTCQALSPGEKNAGLLPRGGPRSTSPPKSPPKSPQHSSGLLDDIVKQATGKPRPAEHSSHSKHGHPHSDGAHSSQTHQAHSKSGGVGHVAKTTHSVPESSVKKKTEPWWKQKGGKPPTPQGQGPLYQRQKLYRARKKYKAELQALIEHPPGHAKQPPKGPGSPDAGGSSQAVSK